MMIRKTTFLLFALIGLTFVLDARAETSDGLKPGETSKLDTKSYSPDYCDFSATLPEEPYISKRCEDDSKEETCFNLISYTKVFDMASTVKIEIICNPSDPKMYEQLTEETMETTVRAMTKETVIEAYEVNSRDETVYRQSGLVGKGRVGMDESIYIAQLWSSPKSLMSVEAQIIGAQMDESDKMFAAILKSIGYVGEHKSEKDSEEKPKEEKKAEPKKKKKKQSTENQ